MNAESIISNKPSYGGKIELFVDNNISIKFSFPDTFVMSNLSVRLNKKLDNSIISDDDMQPVLSTDGQLFSVEFSSDKIKLFKSPFVLYILDGSASIIACDCVTTNKPGNYQDITNQVVIGDETVVNINAELNPASTWGFIEGDITGQANLMSYITANGLTKASADTYYAPIVHSHSFVSITSKPTTVNGFGITDALTASTGVQLSGSYTDPIWLTISKSKVGLSNVLNVIQEPAITSGSSGQYWNGLKQWVTFPTIPTNTSYADLTTNQTILGDKTLNGTTTFNGLVVFSTSIKLKTTISSASALSLTSTNRVYTYTGSTSSIWTMPNLTGNGGLALTLLNTGAGTVTINSFSGANDFYISGALANTMTLMTGENSEIIHNGMYWIVKGS